MKTTNFLIVNIIVAIALLSSCNKPKYTASFSPSKYQRHTEIKEKATPVASEEKVEQNIEIETASSEIDIIQPVKKTITGEAEEVKEEAIYSPSLTKKETKAMKKAVRKIVFKEAKKSLFKKSKSRPNQDVKLLAAAVAFFIPPLGVWLYQEEITNDFWLDILFTLALWLPGVLYAWLVIFDQYSLAR